MDSYFFEFKNGDENAFRHYYGLYARLIHLYAFGYCRDQAEAQDIVQECFINVFTYREKIRDETHFLSFLKKAARHRMIDSHQSTLQRKKREKVWMGDQDSCMQHPSDDKMTEESVLRKIYELYQQMPAGRKDIFGLYFYQHLDVKTIAALRSITPSTVYSHLDQACSYLLKKVPARAFFF